MKKKSSILLLCLVSLFPKILFCQSSLECPLGDLPSITFKGNTSMLSGDSRSMLSVVSSKLKSAPKASIIIVGHLANSKSGQAICNKRIEAIKQYLLEKEGISDERVNLDCDAMGDENTIDIYDPKCGPSNSAHTTDGTLHLGTTSAKNTITEKVKTTTAIKTQPAKPGKKKKHK